MSLTLKCPKHPRYTAKTSPRAACPQCIALYQLLLRAYEERLGVK